ncbi:MAG: FAD binding domain-containing protein [Desulfobacterales bacterium]|jgi:xanthine dehydrogenase YagS FAD-binding subunit|nr:FAD binding domain-containing protein [Desulfobacterales bacterium]
MLPSFSYVRAESLSDAIDALSQEGARLHAGGTDLVGCLRDGVLNATTVVSLSRLTELQDIRQTADGGLRIGALATIDAVSRSSTVQSGYQALAMAAAAVASPQLRHQGTLGGNLCQKPRCGYYRGDFHCLRKGGDLCYAVDGENARHCIIGGDNCYMVHPSDTATALAALEATVVIAGPKGERRVPVEAFYVSPADDYTKETVLATGEILTEILLPPPPKGHKSTYRKVRARGVWDFALAGVALALLIEKGRVAHCRIVLSGAAPVPFRATAAEAVLTGKVLNDDIIAETARAAMKNAAPMSGNRYKIAMFHSIIEQSLAAMA